jgi:amino acid transporter
VPGQTGELKHGVLGLGDAFAQSFALLSLALASSLATSLVAADAGVAAPWAYIVAGAGSLCLASVIIRFTRRMASAGGVYTYSARGLGSGGGSLNISPDVEADEPSIDFTGAGRNGHRSPVARPCRVTTWCRGSRGRSRKTIERQQRQHVLLAAGGPRPPGPRRRIVGGR